MATFVNAIRSEWLKTKNSAASWLCIIGGFLVPLIYCINSFRTGHTINTGAGATTWQIYFTRMWLDMASFLLPVGVMLAASLIAQVEFRNNTWKQLHATPQKYATIYFAKLSVLLLMTVKFFLFFNVGAILSALIPSLMLDRHLPNYTIPVKNFLMIDVCYFSFCLPIILLQFVLSFRIRNFLVPIGIGLAGIIITLIAFQWEYIYLSPYSYNMLYSRVNQVTNEILIYSFAYTIFFTVSGYILYVLQKIKG